MDLKSTQYIEKTGSEVEVSDMVLPSKTSGDVEYIEQDDLSASCKFLIDRTTHWLG